MKTILLALSLVALHAQAQTVEMQLDSVWAPWASSSSHQVAATALRRNATTGALEAFDAAMKVGTPTTVSFTVK